MVLVLLISFALARRAGFSWDAGWCWPSVAGELVVATALYFALRRSLAQAPWPAAE